MIEAIPGWHCEQRASGYVLIPPEGEDAGGIRYQERVRPLRRMRDIVAELPVPGGYRVTAMSPIEPLVTVEGEYGALVVVDGELDGTPLQRTIGAVFGDDYYSLTVGVARRADQFALLRDEVRRLVCHDVHMLGLRRRRYVHAPPAGWQGVFAGLMHVQWLPLDHPRDPSTLAVFPALPAGDGEIDAGGLLSMILGRFGTHAEVAVGDAQVLSTPAGLSGYWWSVAARGGDEVLHDLVVLEDGRYAYPVSLASPPVHRARNVETLRALVDSIQPIPRSTGPRMRDPVLLHWVE